MLLGTKITSLIRGRPMLDTVSGVTMGNNHYDISKTINYYNIVQGYFNISCIIEFSFPVKFNVKTGCPTLCHLY